MAIKIVESFYKCGCTKKYILDISFQLKLTVLLIIKFIIHLLFCVHIGLAKTSKLSTSNSILFKFLITLYLFSCVRHIEKEI